VELYLYRAVKVYLSHELMLVQYGELDVFFDESQGRKYPVDVVSINALPESIPCIATEKFALYSLDR